jgi:hypothetical protein
MPRFERRQEEGTGEGVERITRIGLWWKHTYIGDRKEASRSRGRQELEGRSFLRAVNASHHTSTSPESSDNESNY